MPERRGIVMTTTEMQPERPDWAKDTPDTKIVNAIADQLVGEFNDPEYSFAEDDVAEKVTALLEEGYPADHIQAGLKEAAGQIDLEADELRMQAENLETTVEALQDFDVDGFVSAQADEDATAAKNEAKLFSLIRMRASVRGMSKEEIEAFIAKIA